MVGRGEPSSSNPLTRTGLRAGSREVAVTVTAVDTRSRRHRREDNAPAKSASAPLREAPLHEADAEAFRHRSVNGAVSSRRGPRRQPADCTTALFAEELVTALTVTCSATSDVRYRETTAALALAKLALPLAQPVMVTDSRGVNSLEYLAKDVFMAEVRALLLAEKVTVTETE